MPQYAFAVTDRDGSSGPDAIFDFHDLRAAVQQAEATLAEMALDGLPDTATPLSVRIYSGSGEILVELRLEFRAEFFTDRCVP